MDARGLSIRSDTVSIHRGATVQTLMIFASSHVAKFVFAETAFHVVGVIASGLDLLGGECRPAAPFGGVETVEDGIALIIGLVTGFDRQCRVQAVGTLARVAVPSGGCEVDLVSIAFVLAAERTGGRI